MHRTTKWSFPFRFSDHNYVNTFSRYYECYMPHQTSSRLNYNTVPTDWTSIGQMCTSPKTTNLLNEYAKDLLTDAF
jgi:hypothetical protein